MGFLLTPFALVTPIVKPTIDSLQMMKGFYRLLKRKAFVDFADRGLVDISRIELIVQSAFISHRFLKLRGKGDQKSFTHKILRLGIIVSDGTHQVIQWEHRYQIVRRIYQSIDWVLSVLEAVRMIPHQTCTLNMDWRSRLPQIDLYVSFGGLGLRSINACIKNSPFKYIRVAVDGLSFYADWKNDPVWKQRSNILKDFSYLVKAGEGIYRIWSPDPEKEIETGISSRVFQTLPYIIVPAVSLFRAIRAQSPLGAY